MRGIAAFMVIVHHFWQIGKTFLADKIFVLPFFKISGKLGVCLFFVLSGFLITLLLIREKGETSTINLRRFYLRRILRIWPLFYLLAILCLFVFPHFNFFDIQLASAESTILAPVLYLALLPNLALALQLKIPFAAVLWSVGVEEQFYALWPLIVRKADRLIRVIPILIILYFLLKSALYLMPVNGVTGVLLKFLDGFMVQSLLSGAIVAILYYRKDKLLDVLYATSTQVAAYVILLGLFVYGGKIPYLHFEVYTILFAIIVLNLGTNDRSILSLENGLLRFLGKISYGLYIYHSVCIFLVFKVLFVRFDINSQFTLMIASIILTIVIATLSFRFFERYFLRLKPS